MSKLITLNNFVLLTIFCTPLYLIRVSFFGLPSNLFELLAIIGIILTLSTEKTFFLERLLKIPRLLLMGSMLLLLGILVSTFSNDNPLVGLGIFKGWFLIPMLFSFLLYTRIKSRSQLEQIFWSIYLSSAVVGLISLAYKIAGIVTYDNRLSAFYLSPNQLAMSLSPGVFFGFYFLLKPSAQQKIFTARNALHLVLIFALLLPLYYTYSYSAWFAVFITLSVILFSVNASKKYLMSLFLFLIFSMLILVALQTNTEKFSSLSTFSSRSSLASRQTIWQVSKLIITENPVLGIGPGNFQLAYLSLQPKFTPYLEWAVPQPHNLFLAFWLQSGILGLVGFLSLLFLIFQGLWKTIKNKKDSALAAPLLGFFLYTILHGLLDTTYWKNDLSFLFWIAVFMVAFLNAPPKTESHN